MRERPISAVPWFALVLFTAALGAQLLFQQYVASTDSNRKSLPDAPTPAFYSLTGLGDANASSKVALLWLQSVDMQQGRQINYRQLDYPRLVEWLTSLSNVDPDSSYSLLLATHIYTNSPDPLQKRQMLDFVKTRFLLAPDRHWRWMTHAATIARHQLDDLELALAYAELLRTRTSSDRVPGWARQMSIFLLEDMGETEAATIILGGLLESGAINDEHERTFLVEKLNQLKNQTPSR